MAIRKKSAQTPPHRKGQPQTETEVRQAAAYEVAVERFEAALDILNKGDYEGAKSVLAEVLVAAKDEPELSDRARTYLRVCERRLAPKLAEPTDNEQRYYRAVMLANSGNPREAIKLLDEALRQEPTSVRLLYARASAWGLEGKADQALADLRQAVSAEPRVRFQAANDPDFEKIREEPSFIDLIEPTPSRA